MTVRPEKMKQHLHKPLAPEDNNLSVSPNMHLGAFWFEKMLHWMTGVYRFNGYYITEVNANLQVGYQIKN